MTGVLAGPDLPHFKKSLWPEFRAWCPDEAVVPEQRYRLNPRWEPHEAFILTFVNKSQLLCGGMENPGSWEGPNVHFAHLDEARRLKTAEALKVLDGRVRLPLPDGKPPALWLTTTPRKHWLYDYFGPWDKPDEPDPRAEFKADSLTLEMWTEYNERAGNLIEGFTNKRGQSLTEAEKRVLLRGQWETIDDVSRFLPTIALWDACQENLPALDRNTPIILAADGSYKKDWFALIGCSRHPDPNRHQDTAVRLVRAWKPQPGQPLNFAEIEAEIVNYCKTFAVYEFTYDPYQLKYLAERLMPIVLTHEFSQQTARTEADNQLLDMITQRKIAHDGNLELRQHMDNADKKIFEDRKIRIVKREENQKIDLVIATVMANARCLLWNF